MHHQTFNLFMGFCIHIHIQTVIGNITRHIDKQVDLSGISSYEPFHFTIYTTYDNEPTHIYLKTSLSMH